MYNIGKVGFSGTVYNEKCRKHPLVAAANDHIAFEMFMQNKAFFTILSRSFFFLDEM
jgi:hypothetical protein